MSASSTTPAWRATAGGAIRGPVGRPATRAHATAEDCKVIYTMSASAGSQSETGVRIAHPNRDKPVVRATRATVIALLVASAALVLLVTLGGIEVFEGSAPVAIQVIFVVLYLLLAFYAGRWNRGVLPVASALAILLAIFALVAAPSWFNRNATGFKEPTLNAGLLGVLTLLVVPLQILLVAFAMRGFSQGWNVELELHEGAGGAGRPRSASPHPA